MKILYIAAQNVVGQLELWQKIHRARGNECRYVTYFPSAWGFPDDICLHLPLTPHTPRPMLLRNWLYRFTKGPGGNVYELPGNPPIWRPGTPPERVFFRFRDQLWRFWVEPAIKRYGLMDYDIYHLEGGLEFYRNGGFVRRLSEAGKAILGTYHGMDFRNRGVIPAVDRYIQLNLTSELDLLPRHPNMHYLYLPFDMSLYQPTQQLHDPITLCHAPRNKYGKGSEDIIAACRALEESHGTRFHFIHGKPHAEVMALKARSDIYIDQVADIGPGYGMNSVEAMALGLACCTRMNEEYQAFMPDHPFIHVTPDNLLEKLTELWENPELILEKGREAHRWGLCHHDLSAVGDQLYGYYQELGIP